MAETCNIVIAENDRVYRRQIEGLVKNLGHNVLAICESGHDLVAQVMRLIGEGKTIDLVITDLEMDREGVEAVQSLRASQVDLPVLIITGHEYSTKGASVKKLPNRPFTLHKTSLSESQLAWSIPQAIHSCLEAESNAKLIYQLREKGKRDSLLTRAANTIMRMKVGRKEKCDQSDARLLIQEFSMGSSRTEDGETKGQDIETIANLILAHPAFAETVSQMPIPKRN